MWEHLIILGITAVIVAAAIVWDFMHRKGN